MYDTLRKSDFCLLFISEAVERFQNANNNELPKTIVVYRDGVGDGNLGYVCEQEVKNIKVVIFFFSRRESNEIWLKNVWMFRHVIIKLSRPRQKWA